MIEALVEAGADPGTRDNGGRPPLHVAAGENAAPVVEVLIEVGADPGARDENGRFPFDYAEDNEALQEADAYRRLNEARFK